MSRSGVCGVFFFYIAYNTCIYSHSILSNVYYLIISRKHFHINIYIYTYKYIFFISLCTPTNWITTYTLLPSHLFPIKKLRIYINWPALGVMDPSVLLRNFRENRDFLFDMIWVFFFFYAHRSLDISFHIV